MHLLTLSQTVGASERIEIRNEVVAHIERVVLIIVSENLAKKHQVVVSANCFECFKEQVFVILLQKGFLVVAAFDRLQFTEEGHRVLNLLGGQYLLQITFGLQVVEPS